MPGLHRALHGVADSADRGFSQWCITTTRPWPRPPVTPTPPWTQPGIGGVTLPTPRASRKLIRGERFDVIRIDQANGEQVSYRVNGTRLERNKGDEWIPIIRRVASSIMLPDQREHVRAWRWELAMETKSRFLGDPVRFSFTAVPGHPLAPRPAKAQPPTPTPEPSP